MKYLVVGANGFIGSWICRLLAEEGTPVVALNRTVDRKRTAAVLSERHHRMIDWRAGDVRDVDLLKALLRDGVTHVISLAGMLRPASERYTPDSMAVSVGGLLSLLDAVASLPGVAVPLVYSSAGAVYGPGEAYRDGTVTAADLPRPADHYGIQRYAMEQTARVAWRTRSIPSVGLRPWIVYGAGRENGLTAAPSLALLAAAARVPYHIPFGGASVYHHVSDVAASYVAASRITMNDAVVANIPGETLTMSEIVSIIEKSVPQMRNRLTFDDLSLTAPHRVQDDTLRSLTGFAGFAPATKRMPETIDEYATLLREGRANVAALRK